MTNKKHPTIEALEAALSEHNEALTPEDRKEQNKWFFDAVAKSKLLEDEVTGNLAEISGYPEPGEESEPVSIEHLATWLNLVAAQFFFIGWHVRGAIEDDEKLRRSRLYEDNAGPGET